MKAVSQIISVLLVLSIALVMVVFLWFFISGTYTSLTQSGESTVGETLITISSCMRIESVSGNKVYIKNCGEGVIAEDTLSIYLNDIPLNFTMDPISDTYECSSATEYQTITVTCPNNLIIGSIENSIYVDHDSPASCLKPDPAGYSNIYCNYADTCIGKNSCSFYVSNTNCGGNPAPGETKILILNVGCYSGKSFVKKDEVGTINLQDLWELPKGRYLLRATNPKVITEREVEAVSIEQTTFTVLDLELDEDSGNTAYDSSSYGNDGTLYGGLDTTGWTSDCISGNCLKFDGVNDYVRINDIETDTSDGAYNTVDFWMYWYGDNCEMPFSWMNTNYDLWLYEGYFGFNTGNNDILGISSIGLENRWVHVTAVFYNGVPNDNTVKLYIDGVKQDIDDRRASTAVSRSVTSGIQISSWNWDISTYAFTGIIDSFKVYNTEIIPYEIWISLKPVSYD